MREVSEILGERDAGTLVQLAGWSRFEQVVGPVLARLGFKGIGQAGRAASAGPWLLYRTAPDRVLLRGGTVSEAMALAGPELTALDLTQSRRCLTLTHENLEEIVPLLLSIDTRPSRWPAGTAVQTGLHGISVLAHRTGENELDLLVPATWASSITQYLHDILVHRAAE